MLSSADHWWEVDYYYSIDIEQGSTFKQHRDVVTFILRSQTPRAML
jgi:hypothetical protein